MRMNDGPIHVWTFLPDVAAALGDYPESVVFTYWNGRHPFPENASEVQVLVPGLETRDTIREAISTLPHLRLVQVLFAGVDWLLDAAPDQVVVANSGDANAGPVADWVVSALINEVREFWRFPAQQRDRLWTRHVPPTVHGTRVTILGMGSIGNAVARRLEPFGCVVTGVARRSRPGAIALNELAEVLPRTDALVVLTPLSPETTGMVDATMLAALPDQAIVINAARGPVVNTDALVAELVKGVAGGVGCHGPRATTGRPPLMESSKLSNYAPYRRCDERISC